MNVKDLEALVAGIAPVLHKEISCSSAPLLKRLQDVESSNKDVAELAPQVRTLREEVQALSDKSNSTMSVNELLTRLHHGLKSLRASTHD